MFDLKPRNKKIGWFRCGSFSWHWMLDEGVGLLLGYGRSKNPTEFSYVPDKKDRCPAYNDGYYVSADLAWAMAQAAIGLASSQRRIIKEWELLEEGQRKEMEKWNEKHKIYRTPVRKDFIEMAERFAEWAQKSQGFYIF